MANGDECWGKSTFDSDGAGRRVYVKGFPSSTRVEELISFFGSDRVEGVCLSKKRGAFVQFVRPMDATLAISRHEESFKGQPLRVRMYYNDRGEGKQPRSRILKLPHQAPVLNIRDKDRERDKDTNSVRAKERIREREKDRDRMRDKGRDRERNRTSDRSRDKVRDRSPTRRRRHRSGSGDRSRSCSPIRHRVSDRSASDTPTPKRHSPEMPTPPSNRTQTKSPAVAPDSKESMDDALFGYKLEMRTNGLQSDFKQRQLRYQAASTMSSQTWFGAAQEGGNLPAEVELTLQLVLQKKSAKTLSVYQIDSIIGYFESEKLAVRCASEIGVDRPAYHMNDVKYSIPAQVPIKQQVGTDVDPDIANDIHVLSSPQEEEDDSNMPDYLQEAARLLSESMKLQNGAD